MFLMLLKFQRIREPISQCLQFPVTVLDLVPSAQENGILNETVEHLNKFESVLKILQGGGENPVTLYGARALFNGLLKDFPHKSLSYLRANAAIVNNADFENTAVKLQS